MTVHFAAARSPAAPSIVARILSRKSDLTPANDEDGPAVDNRFLHAALREFAIHGMGTFAEIERRAEQALAAGDIEHFEWWLGICRILDPRAARKLAALNEERSKFQGQS